jgi:hypothetical protein
LVRQPQATDSRKSKCHRRRASIYSSYNQEAESEREKEKACETDGVTMDVSGELLRDTEAEMRQIMARQ